MPKAPPPPAALSALILSSFRRVVGKELLPRPMPDAEAARWLYADAPFCVVAHNTEADPIFTYANKAAQHRFEYDWDEFLTIPSRLSAEAPDRAERQRLFDIVARDGFAKGYSGVRVSKSGRRFLIDDGVVWQLIDETGTRHGEAAMFATWRDV